VLQALVIISKASAINVLLKIFVILLMCLKEIGWHRLWIVECCDCGARVLGASAEDCPRTFGENALLLGR
jgi:hypothetical protein